MIKYFMILVFVFPLSLRAEFSSYEFRHSPSDYLLKDRGRGNDPVFDNFRTIELGINLSSGVDCGRLDLRGSLRSSIDKILDPQMFGNALENIAGGAPLLTICYFSPTWCALAKHFRLNAQSMSQIRLDQCSLMDKYVDSRVEDYYAERQDCLHKELQNTNGNQEEAISRCGGSGLYQKDLANWAGEKFGSKVQTNKLIESSARWAGLTGPGSKKAVELVKAFVGDTTISRGQISVEYGPRKTSLSPSKHLKDIKKRTYEDLCGGVLGQIDENGSAFDFPNQIEKSTLEKINENGEKYVDEQTLYYLALMPPVKRDAFCEKLASSIAMSKFSNDVGRSVHILNELSNNPNLPPNRKSELESKARRFKNAVEISIELERQQNQPINQVVAQINLEGQRTESRNTDQNLKNETASSKANDLRKSFFDCADGVFCETGGR